MSIYLGACQILEKIFDGSITKDSDSNTIAQQFVKAVTGKEAEVEVEVNSTPSASPHNRSELDAMHEQVTGRRPSLPNVGDIRGHKMWAESGGKSDSIFGHIEDELTFAKGEKAKLKDNLKEAIQREALSNKDGFGEFLLKTPNQKDSDFVRNDKMAELLQASLKKQGIITQQNTINPSKINDPDDRTSNIRQAVKDFAASLLELRDKSNKGPQKSGMGKS
ncbi:MAG: hypothetical protein ACJAS6_000119 [Rickettsiales bacterium]